MMDANVTRFRYALLVMVLVMPAATVVMFFLSMMMCISFFVVSVIERALFVTMKMRMRIGIVSRTQLLFRLFEFGTQGGNVPFQGDLLAGGEFGQTGLDVVGDGLHDE